eukprot:TRINITY_DN5330_c0_g1_i1.p1 TRINITY_DN5330_c0_g1~~TRINITY_DN5330_c0_g1_i1.p1  ORF type:complete len:229 (+),score=67.41 TRINITY_DN5330_c0_g1_i1:198-884(+)
MNFGGQQPQGPPRLSGFSDRPGGAFQVGQKRPFPDGHGQPAQQPAHVGFGAPNGGPGGSHFLPRHPSEPAPFGSPPPAVGWRDPALFVHETAEKRRQLLDNPQLLASRLTELERIADDSSNKLEAVQLELEASRSERDRLKLELHQSNEGLRVLPAVCCCVPGLVPVAGRCCRCAFLLLLLALFTLPPPDARCLPAAAVCCLLVASSGRLPCLLSYVNRVPLLCVPAV